MRPSSRETAKDIHHAFQEVDRADFVLSKDREIAGYDMALGIGHGQTISQSSTVAFMLELLQPKKGDVVLDVGSGSGWTTALLASIVGETGAVYGVELIPELVEFGRENLSKYSYPWAEIVQAGEVLGLPDYAPFDKILVSAADESIPQELILQLKKGGTLVAPIDDALWRIKKATPTRIEARQFEGFAFVPLRRYVFVR